ncbi:MAG TPA: pyridoxal-phosphate dependent enzyme, partial [Devosia sp.]|nr:pyridoxal-phosphate dependent enzyme [Devosia sp.]
MIPFTEVLKARERLANRVLLTPMRAAPGLDRRTGQHVRLKCEHQQTTGSFKLRGATNALLLLDEEQRRRGVVAASTGNHGRALAHAARQMGVPAVICMSSLVPANKVEAIEALGATVRIIGRSQDDAQREVDRLVSDDGLVMVA